MIIIFFLNLNDKVIYSGLRLKNANCTKNELLKNMVKFFYNYKCDTYRILYSKYGKPYIEALNCKHFYFNYSDSKDLELCSISNQEIGVDIQYIYSFDYKRFISRIVYLEEFEEIGGINLRNFFVIWCVKEAYLKFLGIGIVTLDVFKCFRVKYNIKNDMFDIFGDVCAIAKVVSSDSNYLIAICTGITIKD